MTDTLTPFDLIPATPPAYGPETARVVLDIVTQFPDQHDQESWGLSARQYPKCVGGWTCWIHQQEFDFMGRIRGTVRVAQRALDLSSDDAQRLFHGTNETQAVKALEYVAKGDPIDWPAVYAPQRVPAATAFDDRNGAG